MSNPGTISLSSINVGDTVKFNVPGVHYVTAEVAEIVPLQDGGLRKRLFMDARGNPLNLYPDGGTDATLIKAGPPTEEENRGERRYAEEFNKFSSKPNGSMYMLSSHKSTGTILIKISENMWMYYDYSGYGGYEAFSMLPEQAFSYCWDSVDYIFFADEMEVKL